MRSTLVPRRPTRRARLPPGHGPLRTQHRATDAALIAWTAAELLRTAVEEITAQTGNEPITPELVMTGLGKIHAETLAGLTGHLTFTPDEAHATSNGCVFHELLTDKGWAAPRGSKPICTRH